jgi:hypothetical protein
VSGVVKYSKNGTVFYSSARAPEYPLLVDTALYSVGATLSGAVISGTLTAVPQAVAWTAAAGAAVTGSSLRKTAGTAWGNAGAISTRPIAAGDGYVEVTASEPGTYRMVGLSKGNTDLHYADIDFALCECGAELRVYEGGSLKGSFGSFVSRGQAPRALSPAAVVKAGSRNGVLFYPSA